MRERDNQVPAGFAWKRHLTFEHARAFARERDVGQLGSKRGPVVCVDLLRADQTDQAFLRTNRDDVLHRRRSLGGEGHRDHYGGPGLCRG